MVKLLSRLFKKSKKKSIGLSLGGGGTRGFAIFSILDGILKEGVRITHVSGTSVGAFIGAYYCLNEEVDSLYDTLSNYKKKD